MLHQDVDEFLYRLAVCLHVANGYRMGRANTRVRRHRRPRSRQRDQCPGRGGHPTARPDVNDDRHLCVLQRLHDLEHSGDITAGGVEPDDDSVCPLTFRQLDAPVDVVGSRARDRSVHRQHIGFPRALRICGDQDQRHRQYHPQHTHSPFQPAPPRAVNVRRNHTRRTARHVLIIPQKPSPRTHAEQPASHIQHWEASQLPPFIVQ